MFAPMDLAPELVSDMELVARVRDGQLEAFDQLYRRHYPIALEMAREQSDNYSDSEDLVSEAFTAILSGLKVGNGPDRSFSAYLSASVYRLARHRNRAFAMTCPTDIPAVLDSAVVEPDPVEKYFEMVTVAEAFTLLPDRWRAALWYLHVEGLKPAAIATVLGTTPNSVSALAMRARARLRQNYLRGHIAHPASGSCSACCSRLPAYVMDTLSSQKRTGVRRHLQTCARCEASALHLTEVRKMMTPQSPSLPTS